MNPRDRIAAVLLEAYPGKYGLPTAQGAADAVIAELGLRIDRVAPWTRWVTEWQQDPMYCNACGIPHIGECLRHQPANK